MYGCPPACRLADADLGDSADQAADLPPIDHESAFEAGLALILNGLAQRVGERTDPDLPRPARR